MTHRRRRQWRANVISRPVELTVAYRSPTADDCESLGSLMFAAYRGTIDDDGRTRADTVDRVAKFFAGVFGDPLLDCSFVALDDLQPISATLVSMDEHEPLLAQAYTTPERQGEGLASALIQLSMNALASKGLTVLHLMATLGNDPAEHLYRKLGFSPAESISN